MMVLHCGASNNRGFRGNMIGTWGERVHEHLDAISTGDFLRGCDGRSFVGIAERRRENVLELLRSEGHHLWGLFDFEEVVVVVGAS